MPIFKNQRKSLPSLEHCSVEFKRTTEPFGESTPWLCRITTGVQDFFRRINNTLALIRHRELRTPLVKNVCPFRWLHSVPSFFFNMKVIDSPLFMRAMLKHPRKDPDGGLFNDSGNAEVYLSLLKELYPDEGFCADDFIMTCSSKYVQRYRQPILRFLGSKNIQNNGGELQKIAEEVIKGLAQDEKINATQLSQKFSILVISKLLLGHPGPDEIYEEIFYAIDFLNKSAIKKAWKIPFSKEEKQQYQQALEVVRKAIETSLTSHERPCLGSLVDLLREEGQLEVKQIKSLLFIMYLAGSETSASLLGYLLWQLGQHPEYQEEIVQEINQNKEDLFETASRSSTLNKVFAESIRLFTPIYVINREPAADLMCTVKDKEGHLIFSEKIAKGDMLLAASTVAARNPVVYKNPDEFNPHRFTTNFTNLSWLPFGEGVHTCPGQWLAKSEILVFVAFLLQRYHFQSFPDKEMGQKGYLTLKSSEDVWLTLHTRES